MAAGMPGGMGGMGGMGSEIVEALQRQARPPGASSRPCAIGVTRRLSGAGRLRPGLPSTTAAPTSALELMDESRVEADIEISRAMQLIDSTAEWGRRELQTFTSTLCGLQQRRRRLQPAAAGGRSACGKQPARRRGAGAAHDAAARLGRRAGRACSRAPGPRPVRGWKRPACSPASTEPFCWPGRGGGRHQRPRGRARGVLDALLASVPAGELAPVPGVPSAPAGTDGRVAALLSRLFAAIQADTQLPAPVRAVLARLQVAALREVLQGQRAGPATHPVWLLMNRIAAPDSPPRGGDRACRPARLLRRARRGLGARRSGCDAVPPRAGAHRRLPRRAAAMVSCAGCGTWPGCSAPSGRDVLDRSSRSAWPTRWPRCAPAPIRRFVTATWAKVLAEAMVRFRRAGRADAGLPARRRRPAVEPAAARPPAEPPAHGGAAAGLLRRLRSGMALIALPGRTAGRARCADAAARRIAAARAARGSEALTPEQIVQRMREEVIPTRRCRARSAIR